MTKETNNNETQTAIRVEFERIMLSSAKDAGFNKDSAEFPHLLGGGMNAVQALACWLMKPLHYNPLLVLYTA